MNKLGWIAIAMVAACGGGGTGPISRDDAEAPCRTGCEREVMCAVDMTQTVDQCTADCVAQVGGGAIREDAFTDLADCVGGLSCAQNEDGCLTECSPTDAHEEYETRCRAKFAECADAGADLDQLCETTPSATNDDVGFYCLFTPAVMDELRACFDGGCDTIDACYGAVFQRYGFGA